jgi:hypothetical protein
VLVVCLPSWLQGVEQGRFADAALSGKHRLPAAEQLAQSFNAETRARTRQQRGNAELTVKANRGLPVGGVDEVGLVEANQRRDAALLGAGEIAIDQVRFQIRLDQRHDDDDLIDVGDQDMLPAA